MSPPRTLELAYLPPLDPFSDFEAVCRDLAADGISRERAAALEEAAAERVVARLRVEVESPTIGRCRSCGRSCAPWFPLCDRCAGIAARA